jgi:putative ubiquitin-RnfH superfamily antitoxin RatB of RatAB toxin-antitoxin module
LALPAGACVGDALAHAGDALQAAGLDASQLGLAVFGRTASPATRLRDGDRIELLRPLQASPRQAREGRAAAARRRGD